MKLDRQQFEALALEHLDMLYRIGRRMTRDAHKAEDLVQETYLRAFRSSTDFNLQEFGIRPWLIRIMHNLHVSRGQREKRQPVGVDDEHLEAAAVAPDPLPASNWEGMDQHLKRAFDSLPEEYQTAMHLWAIEELSYKEIADALQVPLGTVMSRLHRARQRLSEQLRDFAVREGIIRE
ncbi:MAG TPA: sigma-70 family RNA polymerase sigma factor [Tepidisphaeraceae bacterium]|jgi:RNA polymerase sigma-70 factor (ECF subfamily)